MVDGIGGPRKAYGTDLLDAQWAIMEPLLPAVKPGGGARVVDLREVINTLFSQQRTGCQWDMLPHDLLPKSTVSEYFTQWRDDGTLALMLAAIRGQVRGQAGREPTPSAACIDTQSVKTTEMGGPDRGDDGNKKIQGRKRHLLVDTRGFLIAVVVLAVNLDDGTSAPQLLSRVTVEERPRLSVIFADNKSRNHSLNAWMAEHRSTWTLEVQSPPPAAKGFSVVRIRWVVERTNAWNGRSRRNSKDDERTTASSEARIQWSAIHLMLNRLTPARQFAPFKSRKTPTAQVASAT